MDDQGGWVLKVDIQQFYDMLDKGHLLTFERAHDTKRVLEVLPKRFAKYGLRLHPDKTRLFPFHRPGIGHRASGGGWRATGGGSGPRPVCFDLSGFTHSWARSRKGYWLVKRKTAPDRF